MASQRSLQANDASVSILTALAPSLGSDLAITPRLPLDHQSNRLYDAWVAGEHLIVKEFLKPDEFDDAPRQEYEGLRYVEQLDIAPRPVLRLPPGDGYGPLVIYAYMEGDMWDRRVPLPAELEQLAGLWVRLHALPAEGLWFSRGHDLALSHYVPRWHGLLKDYLAWAKATCPAAIPQAQACLALLSVRQPEIEALGRLDPVLAFCRSDARFANVIARPDGRLGMVDWEDSGLRDPAVDLADLLTHANNEDLLAPEAWQAFLKPYLAERSHLDPDLPRRLNLYLGLFPIFWLAVLSRWVIRSANEGRLVGWCLNTMPANQRLRRWLARAQAWPNDDFSSELAALDEAVFF
jgi:Ser/Thr protein kinase RdoA (MazF antagonist)